MKEMLNKALSAFQKPKEQIDEYRYLRHENYVKEELPKPINHREPIARHVIDQNIINKEDFIVFVTEYKTEATKIFYTERQVEAVFNYSTPASADHGDSKAKMPLLTTEDYQHYRAHIGRQISQRDFVRLLKRMEPFIVALDLKAADDMDIVEMAESLQGITKVDSVMRNASNKFSIDAEVRTGKQDVTIPRIVTFEMPIYKNDRDLTAKFNTELFLSADDGTFIAELVCYNIDQIEEEARRQITMDICDSIDGVKSFAV